MYFSVNLELNLIWGPNFRVYPKLLYFYLALQFFHSLLPRTKLYLIYNWTKTDKQISDATAGFPSKSAAIALTLPLCLATYAPFTSFPLSTHFRELQRRAFLDFPMSPEIPLPLLTVPASAATKQNTSAKQTGVYTLACSSRTHR